MKRCSSCRVSKESSEFHRQKSQRDGLHSRCKSCVTIRNIERWKDPVYKTKELARRASAKGKSNLRRQRLKRNYGITVEEYDQMLADQGGGCAICGDTGTTMNLAVDHCHTTGKVRGILCVNHNVGIGCFQDDPDILRATIDYLTKTRSVS